MAYGSLAMFILNVRIGLSGQIVHCCSYFLRILCSVWYRLKQWDSGQTSSYSLLLTESQPVAVRIQPQDSTSSWESLTSLPTLLQEEDSGLPKLPQPATRDGEPLLPVIGTADCRDRPIHHPDSKPSDDNQLPL